MKRPVLCAIGMLSSIPAFAAPQAQQLSFVACPIMRDTETVPCWLADYEGQRYFLVIQIDSRAKVHPPMLGHKALVEGVPTGETFCGGEVLENVRISVLPEREPACDVILPATAEHVVRDAPRGPGPRDKMEVLRAKGLRPPAGARAPKPEAPKPPYEAREFTVYYAFDWQLAPRDVDTITQAMQYAKQIAASRVEIKGYRASAKLSNGEYLTEKEFVPRRRAQVLASTLAEIGVDESTIRTSWLDEPLRGTGQQDWLLRKATILIVP
ncbi:MAG: hypothetical protein GX535_11025 [Xanthomonadaceae bacterium]|nr:hypothetical protein [Xanthomonadaceae bacterium]